MPLDDIEELVWVDRLRQIPVHPRRQAAHVIPLHRMRGHGNDREMRPGHLLFSVPNESGAFETGIWTSISTQSNLTSA
jgi:hypothetical protein